MAFEVDSYRFVDFITRKVIHSWIDLEQPGEIPWTALERPLSESRIAAISSGGLALRADRPFDQEGERKNPWWGDPSFRVIPADATEGDVEIYHLHIDPSYGRQDLNCVLPLRRLASLEMSGEIGSVSPRHYSFMGYVLDASELLQESVPAMVRGLQEDQVDLALLVPI